MTGKLAPEPLVVDYVRGNGFTGAHARPRRFGPCADRAGSACGPGDYLITLTLLTCI
jgi:hypothetical protein